MDWPLVGIGNIGKLTTSLANGLKLQQRCETCPVYHRAVCSALTPKVSSLLSASMIHRHFQKHDKIWDAGDDASFSAIVVSGAVKLIKLMPDGRQQIIGMHFAPDFIGDPFSQKRKSFAEAATDTELCCFPTREFVRALQKDHEIEHALLEETFQDLTQARDWMLTLGRKSAPEKIATFLVSMMERAENLTCQNLRPLSVNVVLELPLSRAEIADYLGLTLETVSRHFTRLRKQGIVRLLQSNIIEILKASELRRLAGDWDGDEK